jgi:hypothetical protein
MRIRITRSRENDRLVRSLPSLTSSHFDPFDSSSVIDYLKSVCKERGAAVIWAYSDFRDQAIQTFEYMVRILTRQLLAQVNPVPENICKFEEKSNITLEDVQTVFSALLGRFHVVYLCVDALDECEPKVRMQLLNLVNNGPSNLRLFCTARRNVEPEVTEAIRKLSPKAVPMVAHKEDVRIYIAEKIAEDPDPCAMNHSLKEEIIAKIASRCHGMYVIDHTFVRVYSHCTQISIGHSTDPIRA